MIMWIMFFLAVIFLVVAIYATTIGSQEFLVLAFFLSLSFAILGVVAGANYKEVVSERILALNLDYHYLRVEDRVWFVFKNQNLNPIFSEKYKIVSYPDKTELVSTVFKNQFGVTWNEVRFKDE